MFGNMCEEKRVEAAGPIEFRRAPEFVGRERRETARSRRPHAVLVRINSDTVPGKVLQGTTDPTSEVEREPRVKPTEIPPEWSLDVQPALPPGRLKTSQPLCVLFGSSRASRSHAQHHTLFGEV
jgi:hypothetical protein